MQAHASASNVLLILHRAQSLNIVVVSASRLVLRTEI